MSDGASGPSISKNGFLPYELDYIPEDLKKRAQYELTEDEETRVHSFVLLRSMLKDESDMLWLDEDPFLLSFLRARKFDVNRTFQLMKNFYAVMGKHGELYSDFDFADVKRTVERNFTGYLPYRDSEGCVIFVISSVFWNPPAVSFGDIMRYLSCALLHANLSPATQIAGYKFIIDFSNFTLSKLTHIPTSYLWICASALQNSFPGKFREIHIVNQGPVFSYLWMIMKQLLSNKIKERIHFHGKNVQQLHKYLSPSILPAEYGGQLPPFDNTEWKQMLEGKADYYAKVFSHASYKGRSKAEE